MEGGYIMLEIPRRVKIQWEIPWEDQPRGLNIVGNFKGGG